MVHSLYGVIETKLSYRSSVKTLPLFWHRKQPELRSKSFTLQQSHSSAPNWQTASRKVIMFPPHVSNLFHKQKLSECVAFPTSLISCNLANRQCSAFRPSHIFVSVCLTTAAKETTQTGMKVVADTPGSCAGSESPCRIGQSKLVALSAYSSDVGGILPTCIPNVCSIHVRCRTWICIYRYLYAIECNMAR